MIELEPELEKQLPETVRVIRTFWKEEMGGMEQEGTDGRSSTQR
jgi:hypothetical protein